MTLQQIEPASLVPGKRLPASLFNQSGVKLLGPNVTLSESMCRTLAGFKASRLFLAQSLDDLNSLGVVTPATGWSVGHPAPADLLTTGGVLVVSAGETVEEEHAGALEFGAFTGLAPRECARARAQRMKLADELVHERSMDWERLPVRVEPTDDHLDLSGRSLPAGQWPQGSALLRWRSERVRVLRKLYSRLIAGTPADAADAEALSDELIERLIDNPRRFTQLALLGEPRPEFLPDHGYTTGVLSIAIAARLGWSRRQVLEAGVAGFLCDVGMGLVPREIRWSVRKLNDIESNRVRRHPVHSVMLLEGMEGLSETIARAALQHQERENGSGYPHALKSAQICDLARVVAVADCFAASTAPRPYKLERRPYDALEELIAKGADRVLSRQIVRALVESTGLFPVGSHVKLSSGEIAQVVASGGELIDRPTVRVYQRDGRVSRPGRTIDLAQPEAAAIQVAMPANRPSDAEVEVHMEFDEF